MAAERCMALEAIIQIAKSSRLSHHEESRLLFKSQRLSSVLEAWLQESTVLINDHDISSI